MFYLSSITTGTFIRIFYTLLYRIYIHIRYICALKFNFIVLYFMFVHTCFIPASNIGWHPRLMLTFCVHSRIPPANIRSKFIRVSWITHPPFLNVFEERTTIKRKSLMVRRSVRGCIMRDISNHQIPPYCILYFVILSPIILEYRCLSFILRNFVIAIR